MEYFGLFPLSPTHGRICVLLSLLQDHMNNVNEAMEQALYGQAALWMGVEMYKMIRQREELHCLNDLVILRTG